MGSFVKGWEEVAIDYEAMLFLCQLRDTRTSSRSL